MALQQERFTWRHDRALKVLYDFIVCHQETTESFVISRAWEPLTFLFQPLCALTLPLPHQTALDWLKSLFLGTVKTTSHRLNVEKVENYQLAFPDLTNLGLSAKLITIEIGCLGHHLPELLSALKSIVQSSTAAERTMLRDKLAQSVIASSYAIFWVHKKLITWT